MPDLHDETEFADFTLRVRTQWADAGLDELVAHRAEVVTRAEQLQAFEHPSQPQRQQLGEAVAEQMELDSLIAGKHAAVRSQQVDRVRQAAADPANLEAGVPGGRQATRSDPVGRQTEGQFRYRTAAPWADMAAISQGGAVRQVETAAGWHARAHDALSAIEGMPHDGAEMIARMLDNPHEGPRAAQTFMAISDPDYHQAFMSWLRNPEYATRSLPAAESEAFYRASRHVDWRGLADTGGWYVRTAISNTTFAAALPYVLDPTVRLVNAGQANVYRQIGRNETTTSNAWQGVTSVGTTANWISEGATASETSPAASQLQVFPEKGVVYVQASFESLEDTAVAESLPGLVADARDRLETDAYTTGAGHGSTQPLGLLTAVGTAAGDQTVVGTAARAATDLSGLLEGLGYRYRQHDSAAWVSSLTWLNKYRLTAKFSGATDALVDDSGSQPRIWGMPWYECTSFSTASTASIRPLAIAAWNRFLTVDRLPTTLVYDPMIKSTGALPLGSAGYYYFWRTSSAVETTAAFRILRLT
jgi:HK97 family phage major capsid protein